MALNLKRKRDGDVAPRKTRRLSDDSELGSASDAESEKPGPENEGGGDEEWGGITSTQPATVIESNGSKPKLPPTGEELRVINDAQNLFKSSTFKLQIDALLPNVRPKAARIPPLDRFLQTLHGVLMASPPVAPQHPLEAARNFLKKGVSVPYCLPQPSQDTNWKVAFEKPGDITMVGSWPNKISVKGKDGFKFGVDLAIEMPSNLFQEKDYLNGRFFHKRAFYLATLAAVIQDAKTLNVDVTYESASDDPRLTKLVLEPRKDKTPNDFTKLNARVCIIPVLPADSPIALNRLSPSHSNIRISGDSDAESLPTPMYNSALLTALTPKPLLLSTFALKEHTPSFGDALALLRVWANQRGYGQSSGLCVCGFDSMGSWWAVLLGFLVLGSEPDGKKTRKKPLGRGLSSYQLFRAALDFLSRHDFKEAAFQKTTEGHKFPPEEYEAHHEAVLVDSSSTLNVLAGVPIGSLQLLQHDARMTLEKLNDASVGSDPFASVFLEEHRDLLTRFDTVIRVDIASAKPRSPSLHSTLDIGSPANALISSMTTLLRQGLGNRVNAIAILNAAPSTRPLSQALPTNPDVIYVGLIHDPHNAFRLVDHGPAADEPDASVAERFREFWGDKAELRRFKDGRIIESVVWDVKTADERSQVPAMIVRHVLQRHFGLEDTAAVQSWRGFDEVLKLPEAISRVYTGSGTVLGFKGAIVAFDALVKELKSLNDELPLSLAAVSAVSEQLRYTSVFNPVPLSESLATSLPPNARYLPAMEIILHFEKSAKWPDDLRAIQKIKLAFFERMANALMTSVKGLKASVVVGDPMNTSEIQDNSRLEIVTPEGWTFSARIWHDREATLLDRLIIGKNALPHINFPSEKKKGKEQQEAVDAKEVYVRRFIHAPRHHRAIAALNHRFVAFSSTVRLVKRWLASHWVLHGHISEEAVEILCASAFVGDGTDLQVDPENVVAERASVPASKERGFALVVRFLKDWKWDEGLFVHLYGRECKAGDPLPASTSSRAGVWKISTEFDPDGKVWTLHGPDVMVAHRVRALAKATWNALQGMEDGKVDVKSLFIHPTDDYDFVVRMDPAALPRYAQNVDSSLAIGGRYANLPREDSPAVLRPGFDPARLLYDDLQRIYTNTFKIFCDPFGGDRFGAVWDPTLKQPRPFRVLGGFSSVPVKKEKEKDKDKGLVVLNEASIFDEIKRLGGGMVSGITVQV
ncbi:Mannose-6-phosphate isomerase [Mycena sanguinolenta]|uniref:U3 small nucleolar RNA-associated protein 22 n=1 Tax=Mycena sanguinolenta TaxID=230812 RepID=A0A8H6ZCZ3_9AGAR|nr:Mannose-6-phosphate isomerase [Mycena sanguinolenta]